MGAGGAGSALGSGAGVGAAWVVGADDEEADEDAEVDPDEDVEADGEGAGEGGVDGDDAVRFATLVWAALRLPGGFEEKKNEYERRPATVGTAAATLENIVTKDEDQRQAG